VHKATTRAINANANFCLRSVSTFIVQLERFYKPSCACKTRGNWETFI